MTVTSALWTSRRIPRPALAIEHPSGGTGWQLCPQRLVKSTTSYGAIAAYRPYPPHLHCATRASHAVARLTSWQRVACRPCGPPGMPNPVINTKLSCKQTNRADNVQHTTEPTWMDCARADNTPCAACTEGTPRDWCSRCMLRLAGCSMQRVTRMQCARYNIREGYDTTDATLLIHGRHAPCGPCAGTRNAAAVRATLPAQLRAAQRGQARNGHKQTKKQSHKHTNERGSECSRG